MEEREPILETANSNIPTLNTEPIIKFEREVGECYPACPAYVISIYSDGKIVFEGKEHVKTKGLLKGSIPRSKLGELIEKFDDANFFQLSDRYAREENCSLTVLSDSPVVKIYYNNGKASKTVFHYQGCQSTAGNLGKLMNLEKDIEEITSSKQWIE